jgi:hypothetical protein
VYQTHQSVKWLPSGSLFEADTMPTYTREVRLNPTYVTKELVGKLEGALDQWIDHFWEPHENDPVTRNVAIVDAIGTEDLDAIADFDLERFPGTTRKVTLSRSLVSPRLRIGITFSRNTGINGNALRIVLEHPKARELSSGLASELLRIIGTQPYNRWTRGGALFPAVGLLIAVCALVIGMTSMKNHGGAGCSSWGRYRPRWSRWARRNLPAIRTSSPTRWRSAPIGRYGLFAP